MRTHPPLRPSGRHGRPRATGGGAARPPAPRSRPRRILVLLVAALLLLPVTGASAHGGRTATVDVYFGADGSECDVVNPHRRTVALPRVLTGALEELLEGPTSREREQRFAASMFSSRTAGMLRSVDIRDGVAHVDFADLRTVIPGASSSCGSAQLLSQLDATVTQFPTVHRARYSIDGSEATFAEWLQRGAPRGSTVTRTRGSLRNTAAITALGRRAASTLRTVRVGRHAGFDRVVFEFDGAVPSYSVAFRGVAVTGGAAQPIPTRGTTALQVDLGARSYDTTVTPARRLVDPARVTAGYPTVRDVRFGGQFEGWSAFGVGLAGRTGFRVLELRDPARLAIDVAHGARVRTLAPGDRGPDVADWQRRLTTVQRGPFAVSRRPSGPALALDGIYGPRTRAATAAFQRAEGVPVTGTVTTRTQAAMRHALTRAARQRP